MVSKDLIIDSGTKEVSIALLEDKQLVELNKEKKDIKFAVGDIYLGKVKKIMPGLNAAFVNVGYERDAFLHYLDLGAQFRSLHKYYEIALKRKGKMLPVHKFKNEPDINKDGKISDVLKSGQTVIVQVAKEPISTKGPRLGSEISIAGRNLVLLPFSDKVSISTKIESAEEKNRLKALIQSIKPKNYGVIIRTVAEGKKVAILDAELRELVERFEKAFYGLRKDISKPTLFIRELNLTNAILRDILNVSFTNITVNDNVLATDIRQYVREIAPDKEKIVKLYKGNKPIFDHFGVTKQIKTLFGKTVSFKHGSYLIIEHTEALHVIDVNSGNRSKAGSDQETSALQVNLEAAREIARQLRLRDMGGIIVIDFIDMLTNEHRQKLFDTMREIMAEDRTKHNILPLSKYGLMQITRQRVRPEMDISVEEKCPVCNGTGKIGPSYLYIEKIERDLELILEKVKTRSFILKTHPFIAAYLTKGFIPLYKKMAKRHKCKLEVRAIESFHYMEYRFADKFGDEIDLG
ncbi:MAG: Rne/Rng family ribonuclease [Bacteroidales bacterium]|nr:Rne/Rng family ribonuclease [Bacteroidales bacterium]